MRESDYHKDCVAVHPQEPYHRRARFELHKYVGELEIFFRWGVPCDAHVARRALFL